MPEYLPPVVISILGDDSSFLATLAADKAALVDFAKTVTTAPIRADITDLTAGVAEAEAELEEVAKKPTVAKISVDQTNLLAGLAGSRASLQAFAREQYNIGGLLAGLNEVRLLESKLSALGVTTGNALDSGVMNAVLKALPDIKDLKVTPEVAAAQYAKTVAEIDYLKNPIVLEVVPEMDGAALAKVQTDLTILRTQARIDVLLKAPTASEVALASVAAMEAAANPDKKSNTAANLKKLLGLGTGALGLAGAGSVLSFAGLGLDHVIFTAAGLAGTAIGAALGGGLLTLGAGGVAGVGIGTDLAGIGQAAGDIRNVYTALSQGQAAVNTALQGFSAAARPAVLAAAQTAQQFKALFDLFTGPAEAKGAALIEQTIKALEPFLSIIGKFASINMTIITNGLQPFFKWLDSAQKGGGLAIFTQLEKLFSAHLATNVTTFVNALEGVAKLIDYIATTKLNGQLMTDLSNFFKNLNTAFSGGELSGKPLAIKTGVDSLIADFRSWAAFLKEVFRVVDDLFKADKVHTGRSIIDTLTGFLTQLDNFEKSAAGKASIGNLFAVHKGEIMAILDLLPLMAKAFGGLYNALAPALVTVVTAGLSAIAKALIAIEGLHFGKLDFGALAVGLGLVSAKLFGLGGAISSALKALGAGLLGALAKVFAGTALGDLLTKWLGKIGAASGLDASALALKGAATALTEAAAALKGGAAAGAGAGAAGAAGAGAGAGEASLLTKAKAVATGLVASVAELTLVAAGAIAVFQVYKNWSGTVTHPFGTSTTGTLVIPGLTAAQDQFVEQKIANAVGHTQAIPPSLLNQWIAEAKKAGGSVATGFGDGITAANSYSNRAAQVLGTSALDAAKTALKSKSPSQEMVTVGKDFVLGFTTGISGNQSLVSKAITTFGNDAVADAKKLIPSFNAIGVDLMKAIVAGITSGGAGVQAALKAGVTPTVGLGGKAPGTAGNIILNASFNIYAGGASPGPIVSAVKDQAAPALAKAMLTAQKAGAGTLY